MATPPPVLPPGHFRLHSRAIPDLPAGPYTVRSQQTFDAPGATSQNLDTHIEITAPRFTMPRDQVLSTFPPHQAEGPFHTRLPQVVLRRRTLPWERELDGRPGASAYPREIPWLALVVLAEAECEFRNALPISEAVTPGVVLEGLNDTPVTDAIVVTGTVVQKVFPTKEELPLLTHVRAVDLNDTELAMGDDDGWLAVVLSNRLPQPDLRYRACLISLEGQYEVLEDTAGVENDARAGRRAQYVYPSAAMHVNTRSFAEASRSRSMLDAWSTQPDRRHGGRSARQATDREAWRQPGAMHSQSMRKIDPGAKLYTFPVLLNWQFTCKGERGFEQSMKHLDVGILDTVLKPKPYEPGKRPPAPRTRPEPRTLPTGHIELSHLTRVGERASVWYRGPLVPHPTGREAPDGAGLLPMVHASDQARRVGPDGRENVSLAAAFEIGRLLALAEPRIVAAFLNWRKEGYEVARRGALLATDLQLSAEALRAGFAVRMGIRILEDLGIDTPGRFGPPRPLIDPARGIEGLDGDPARLIATGLGLDVDVVHELMNPGAQLGSDLTPPVATQPTDLDSIAERLSTDFTPLRNSVFGAASDVARDALSGSAGPDGPDVLDDLIEGRIP